MLGMHGLIEGVQPDLRITRNSRRACRQLRLSLHPFDQFLDPIK
jgi:hypothetical protein